MQINYPDIIEKLLCGFIENRTARIRIGNTTGDYIRLQSGVPQGSILSPTLYIMYTADLPPAGQGATDIMFADDITQVIEFPHQSKAMTAYRTVREITRINRYEKEWKIATNKAKFKLLSVSKLKPNLVNIDGQNINFTNKINVLGLELTRTGIASHVKKRINLAKVTHKKLKRFSKLSSKIKIHLYKSMIRPIMEYPNTPMCVTSKTNKQIMQAFQRKILRDAVKGTNEEEEEIDTLHEIYKLPAINVRMHRRAQKNWDKFSQIEEQLYERTQEENQTEGNDHNWWPRIGGFTAGEEPEPDY